MFSLLDWWLWRELLFAWICTWKGRYCFNEDMWIFCGSALLHSFNLTIKSDAGQHSQLTKDKWSSLYSSINISLNIKFAGAPNRLLLAQCKWHNFRRWTQAHKIFYFWQGVWRQYDEQMILWSPFWWARDEVRSGNCGIISLTMDKYAGLWSDRPCTSAYHYICERGQ